MKRLTVNFTAKELESEEALAARLDAEIGQVTQRLKKRLNDSSIVSNKVSLSDSGHCLLNVQPTTSDSNPLLSQNSGLFLTDLSLKRVFVEDKVLISRHKRTKLDPDFVLLSDQLSALATTKNGKKKPWKDHE